MIPHRLVQKREYQAASISQDEEMKFGRLYIFVNTWLLYPELEDLNHQGFFLLKLHQYRFLYQIVAVH